MNILPHKPSGKPGNLGMVSYNENTKLWEAIVYVKMPAEWVWVQAEGKTRDLAIENAIKKWNKNSE